MSATKLNKFFFESLPAYFQTQDQGVVEGKGVLERFLSIFPAESNQFLTDIKELKDLIDPNLVPEEFLSYLGALYGFPPNVAPNTDIYRVLLRNAINIYKYKGTYNGVKKFFEAIGVTAYLELVEGTVTRYDDSKNYDEDPAFNYDSINSYCKGYRLALIDPRGLFPELGGLEQPAEIVETITKAMEFLMPIGSSLVEIQYGGISIEDYLNYKAMVESNGGAIYDEEHTLYLLRNIFIAVS